MKFKEYIVQVFDNRDKYWSYNGKLHREDGPAIELADGTKFWYLNGELHREGGPAIEYTNGSKVWSFHGKTHREDGPAIELSNGEREWYLNGTKIPEPKSASCQGKVVDIDGVKYRLILIEKV